MIFVEGRVGGGMLLIGWLLSQPCCNPSSPRHMTSAHPPPSPGISDSAEMNMLRVMKVRQKGVHHSVLWMAEWECKWFIVLINCCLFQCTQ